MQESGGQPELTMLDQMMDQLLIQTVCSNNAMFMPNTSDDGSDGGESEYTYEEVEVTDSGSEADGEETRQDIQSG